MRTTLRILTCLIAIVLQWFCSSAAAGVAMPQNVASASEQLLKQLDEAIQQRERYMESRVARIDSAVEAAVHLASSERADAYIGIAEDYSMLCADSAIAYLHRASDIARAINDSTLLFRSRMTLAAVLPKVFLVREAIMVFDSINVASIPSEYQRQYYVGAAKMYDGISDNYSDYPDIFEKYTLIGDKYRQKAMLYYPPESLDWLFHEASHFYVEGNYSAAIISAAELMDRTEPTERMFGRAAYLLARISALRGDKESELYYKAQYALSEVLRGDREGMALQSVGHMLYREGDINRAHAYLSVALEAAAFGAGHHHDTVADSMLIIDKAYKEQLNRNSLIFWCLIVVLTLLLLVMVYTLMRYRSYLRHMNEEHKHVMRLREDRVIYLTNFLRVCAVSMRRMTEFSRAVQRKLAAKQFEEVFRNVKSGQAIDTCRRDILGVFDATFIKIYPNFVDEFNHLLRPEEHYSVAADGRMSPELRIAALMRLGLDDTARMAEFLGYSPNTIYAYRAKIRAKAIDSSTFDRDFQSLCSKM